MPHSRLYGFVKDYEEVITAAIFARKQSMEQKSYSNKKDAEPGYCRTALNDEDVLHERIVNASSSRP